MTEDEMVGWHHRLNGHGMEIETVIRNLSANKRPGLLASQLNSTKKFREQLTPSLLKLFQKIAEEGKRPNSFYEAAIT